MCLQNATPYYKKLISEERREREGVAEGVKEGGGREKDRAYFNWTNQELMMTPMPLSMSVKR